VKAQVLDQGKSAHPDNWINTEADDDSFALYVDGKYIAVLTVDANGNFVLVSSSHRVDLLPY